MTEEEVEALIVGGGLSGIYAAWLLARGGRSCLVLEGRGRLGGRILCPEHAGGRSDLGPSWYWPAINPRVARLIERLGLRGFRQFEHGRGRFEHADGTVHTVGGFGMDPPSWRLAGGMRSLIRGLCRDLPPGTVRLDHPVCRIERRGGGARVGVGEVGEAPVLGFSAGQVILALPPRLAAATILFEPDLDPDLAQAMLRTGTWMAGQAKFHAFYDEPTWRNAGLSGQAFSQRGPLGEIHDGSNDGRGPYGLTGFVGLPAVQRGDPQRVVDGIVGQLARIFGGGAARPAAFFYRDWARERFTATSYDQPPMLAHPVYGPPAGRTWIWQGTLHFAGTETAGQQGGYLEGALCAAERAVEDCCRA